MTTVPRLVAPACLLLLASACGAVDADGSWALSSAGSGGLGTTSGDDDDGGTSGSGGETTVSEPRTCDDAGCLACTPPQQVVCPATTPLTELDKALGVNCGGFDATVSSMADPGSVMAIASFGHTTRWQPREGQSFVVIGTGKTTDIGVRLSCGAMLGQLQGVLPPPLQATPLEADCATNPELVGTGDCSGTLLPPGPITDVSELRVRATVPEGVTGISFDVALLSEEFRRIEDPATPDDIARDFMVVWLQSERWSGNVVFEEPGQLIDTRSELLSLRDREGALPELFGTCLERGSATRWMHATAPVSPGETITLVFLVAETTDATHETFLFVDNLHWSCSPFSLPQTTLEGTPPVDDE